MTTEVLGWAIKSDEGRYAHPGAGNWGERYLWPTKAAAQAEFDSRKTHYARIVKVVRRAAENWGVWCTPKRPAAYKDASWLLDNPITKESAEEAAAAMRVCNECWHYEVRTYPPRARAEYIIRSRTPYRYATRAEALAKVDLMNGGRRQWVVRRVSGLSR